MFDATPMQVLSSGTVSNGTAGGFAFAGRGAVPARTGAGTYTLTLDAEAGGGAASPNAIRCFAQSLTLLQVCQCVKTSATVTTVTSAVATTGVATDGTFDWLILKDPTITT